MDFQKWTVRKRGGKFYVVDPSGDIVSGPHISWTAAVESVTLGLNPHAPKRRKIVTLSGEVVYSSRLPRAYEIAQDGTVYEHQLTSYLPPAPDQNPASYWHVILVEPAKTSKARQYRSVRLGDALVRMYFFESGPRGPRGGRKWTVQSILLPKAGYTAKGAAKWAILHGFADWIRVEG